MHKNTPNISKLIDSLFPDHVVASYPKLIEFAKAFFEFLEKENKASYYQNTLQYQRDVREQDPEFLEYIQRELGVLNFQKFAANPKLFYDNLSQIWRSKGSEESIKAFFRLFLDDEVEIYYPWESVLIPSDGRWIINTVLRVSKITGNPEDFVGKKIFQENSDGQAVVNKVVRKIYSDGIIYELELVRETITGTFVEHSNIYYTNENNIKTLVAEVYRSANGLTINNGGTNYSIGDKITVTGYEGSSFIAYVNNIGPNGEITKISIVDFGSGNTPRSVIETNINNKYYSVDFIIYNYLSADDILGLVTESATGSVIDYGLITQSVVSAEDYGVFPKVLINIESESGTGAELTIQYGAIATYAGYYEGIKGQLSEGIVLQDSKYYQKFSYEVKTSTTTNSWIQPLKKFAHPTGVEVIGNIFTFSKHNANIKNTFIFAKRKDPVSYTFIEKPGISDKAFSYTQDYVENAPLYFMEDYVGISRFSDTNIIASEATVEIFDAIIEQPDL